MKDGQEGETVASKLESIIVITARARVGPLSKWGSNGGSIVALRRRSGLL